MRSTRYTQDKCRSQVFPRSAGSCEILLQHYLYVSSVKEGTNLKQIKRGRTGKRKG